MNQQNRRRGEIDVAFKCMKRIDLKQWQTEKDNETRTVAKWPEEEGGLDIAKDIRA